MKRLRALATAVLLSAPVMLVYGQGELTEQFIPIGRSPGLSGTGTAIGSIQARQGNAVTVADARGAQTFRVTDRTRIWIDRSAQKLTNVRGSVSDLQPGRRIEVKRQDKEKDAAEWIKVEAPASGSG